MRPKTNGEGVVLENVAHLRDNTFIYLYVEFISDCIKTHRDIPIRTIDPECDTSLKSSTPPSLLATSTFHLLYMHPDGSSCISQQKGRLPVDSPKTQVTSAESVK